MHSDHTTYRLVGPGEIEASHPMYAEPVEVRDWLGHTGDYTQALLGHEKERLYFRLGPNGALAIDSYSDDLPGWHQVTTLGAGATADDVLEFVRGKAFLGRQFWRAA